MERKQMIRSGKKTSTRNRGVAMLMVMVAVGIVMTMALTFVAVNSTGNAIASSSSRQAHARHIAETGIALAIREISGNPTWRDDYSEGQWVYGHAYAGGAFDIYGEDGEDLDGDRQIGVGEGDGDIADDATDPLTITSVATYRGANYTVQVTLRPKDPEIKRNISIGRFEVEGGSIVDSFESTLGPYGGANVGSEAVIGTNSTEANKIKLESVAQVNGDAYVGPGGDVDTVISIGASATLTGDKRVLEWGVEIPTITAPTDMGASVGDVTYDSGTTVLSADLHCDKLVIKNSAVLQISGDRRILCEDEFDSLNDSRLEILPGSSLTIYTKKKVETRQSSEINTNTGDPRKLTWYHISTDHFDVEDFSKVCATVVGKTALLHLKGDTHFYGLFAGEEVEAKDRAQMHHDLDAFIPVPKVLKIDTGITVTDSFEIKDTAVVDSFDSNLGPYGGANVGSDASVSTNKTDNDKLKVKDTSMLKGDAWVGEGGDPVDVIQLDGGATITGDQAALPQNVSMPGYSEPTILPEGGDLTLSAGTTGLTGDVNIDKLTIENSAVLEISGVTRLICRGDVTIQDFGKITILPGAQLRLYFRNKFELKDDCEINVNSANPDMLIVYNMGSDDVKHTQNARMYATVFADNARLLCQNDSQFYGTFKGKNAKAEHNARFHVDVHGVDEPEAKNYFQIRWNEQP